MKIVGIDYGSKRIGVALSDETGKFALPHSVILNTPTLPDEIKKIADLNKISEIVLGESKDFKGSPNEILAETNEFKKKLESLGYTVHFEPEFMTSQQAERLQGMHDKIDSSAAAIILQTYLDRKNSR